MAIKETYRLHTLRAGMLTSLKSGTVMTHDQSNNYSEQEQMNSILD